MAQLQCRDFIVDGEAKIKQHQVNDSMYHICAFHSLILFLLIYWAPHLRIAFTNTIFTNLLGTTSVMLHLVVD